jgi:hypothetical protein
MEYVLDQEYLTVKSLVQHYNKISALFVKYETSQDRVGVIEDIHIQLGHMIEQVEYLLKRLR